MQAAHTYFEDVFPAEAVIMPASASDFPAELSNLSHYGLGMAEILLPQDGGRYTAFYATYIISETVFTEALKTIYIDEIENDILPAGSHERALDDMISGVFEQRWRAYLLGH
ncbi:hypothetical protein BH23PAT1_BH23PAT1_3320 [soil metagenome]